MNIDEVKQTIRRGSEAAAQTKSALEQAGSETASSQRLVQLTVHDSQNDDVKSALKILGEMDGEITRALRRIDAAVEHADAYLTALG
ncbi:hypothetical protein AAH979_00605 [Plantactinospora sp. ZYX-F-223]|uniref:hypothetical protein n=1 Tax=Plantactinospora sp. ZYX-F-223 TaxID=3144103 RepID=UPI0031FCAFC5